RRRHTRFSRDWSSDVCSSDLSQIDRDNFNDIMSKVNPQLRMKVENMLEGDGSEMSVNLDFKNMEDFESHKIVEQIEPLKKLMERSEERRVGKERRYRWSTSDN